MIEENFHYDPCLQALAGLTAYEPEPECADRIRERCHARLTGKRQARGFPSTADSGIFPCILEASLVAVACLLFLSEVVHRALRLYGW